LINEPKVHNKGIIQTTNNCITADGKLNTQYVGLCRKECGASVVSEGGYLTPYEMKIILKASEGALCDSLKVIRTGRVIVLCRGAYLLQL